MWSLLASIWVDSILNSTVSPSRTLPSPSFNDRTCTRWNQSRHMAYILPQKFSCVAPQGSKFVQTAQSSNSLRADRKQNNRTLWMRLQLAGPDRHIRYTHSICLHKSIHTFTCVTRRWFVFTTRYFGRFFLGGTKDDLCNERLIFNVICFDIYTICALLHQTEREK